MKIKVLTLNIWEGRLLDSVITFINQINPDIVLLQEVFDGSKHIEEERYRSYEILKEKLSLLNRVLEPSFLDINPNGKVPQGNAVFSRFPIDSKKIIFFDVPFGEFNLDESDISGGKNQYIPMGMLRAEIKIDDKKIYSYSVHGIWGFDGKDSPRRLQMSKTIVDEIKDKESIIMGGDFNLNSNTKTVVNIEEVVQSVFKHELKSTFNMKHKELPGYATANVDMLFVSRNMKIISHEMPQVDVSDHMPLFCELEV